MIDIWLKYFKFEFPNWIPFKDKTIKQDCKFKYSIKISVFLILLKFEIKPKFEK